MASMSTLWTSAEPVARAAFGRRQPGCKLLSPDGLLQVADVQPFLEGKAVAAQDDATLASRRHNN